MPAAIIRLRDLRGELPTSVLVQLVGGITHDNAREANDAGADLLVAGSSIFQREDLPRAYRRLVRELG